MQKMLKAIINSSNTFFQDPTRKYCTRIMEKKLLKNVFSSDNIDLILMDIKMPVMDGYTAVKLIREKNAIIPIIAQTAYADDREKAIECGCSGFISKPFDRKSLFKVLCEFI